MAIRIDDSFERESSARGGRPSGRRSGARRSGRRPGGGGLASARDRQRLRERNREERARVERMLATAPMPVEPILPVPERSPAGRTALELVPESQCPVCAGSEIVTDEVMRVGTLHLSECLHCDFRWTERRAGRWAGWGPRERRRAPASVTPGTPSGRPPGLSLGVSPGISNVTSEGTPAG